MKNDVVDYVSLCLTFQQVKAKHKKPARLMQKIEIPKWKWKKITIDFVTSLLQTLKRYNFIRIILDRMTKAGHIVPVKATYRVAKYTQLYLDEIVRLHRVLVFIISDRVAQYTSQFWKTFQETLGTYLSTT